MNKKSSLISEEEIYLASIQTANNGIAAVNAFTESIKPPDFQGGSSMGEDEGWDYVKKAYENLSNKRNLVLEELVDFDVFSKQFNDTTKLLELKKLYGNWVGDMKPTFILLGKHLMKHAKFVKDALKTLADNTSSYKPTYNEINKLYTDRNKKKEATQADKKRIADLEKHIQGLEQRIQESNKTGKNE